MDLTRWSLCTPEADPVTGRARIWPNADLVPDHAFFARQADGGVLFHAPVAGACTENTDRTRSELREVSPIDGAAFNWAIGSPQRLRAALQVDRAPSNGVIVVGQIHSRIGQPVLKLKWKRGDIVASVRLAPGVDPVDTVIGFVPLATRFTYSIGMSARGVLSVSTDRSADAFVRDLEDWAGAALYWKAGIYNQDPKEDTPDEAGTVRFSRLEIVR